MSGEYRYEDVLRPSETEGVCASIRERILCREMRSNIFQFVRQHFNLVGSGQI